MKQTHNFRPKVVTILLYVIRCGWNLTTSSIGAYCLLWIKGRTWNCLHEYELPAHLNHVTFLTNYALFKCRICIWTASSEFGTYRLCEQRRFRRACASAQSRQNLRCSLIEAVNQEEPSVRKPDPWPLWMAGHAQLKFVMTECSKTQIRLTGLIFDEQCIRC